MTGSGGAVTSVDRDASQVGIDVLAKGGNAADAAVATAAALGVTEPYSAGIGGGGFLVYYDARTHKVRTIDGRETAPKTFTPTTFTKPDGTAMDFNTVVSSGLSVGVPGTPALWDLAARDFGTRRLADLLAPAERLARTGFTVDQTFHDQTAQNADRFAKFPATAKVFLPGGKPPAVGSVVHEPGHGQGLRRAPPQGRQRRSTRASSARTSSRRPAHRTPPTASASWAGRSPARTSRTTSALKQGPRPLDVRGPGRLRHAGAELRWHRRGRDPQPAARPTSCAPGPRRPRSSNVDYLHRFSEASATAFADRNRYVGDVPGVPVAELTSKGFADERACLFDPDKAPAAADPVRLARRQLHHLRAGHHGAG